MGDSYRVTVTSGARQETFTISVSTPSLTEQKADEEARRLYPELFPDGGPQPSIELKQID